MNKLRVIDLLNKIANREEIPSPIYHNNLYYDFEDGDYFNQKTRKWLFNDSDIETILNDEVKTKEEDKKIEKVNTYVLCDSDFETMGKHSTKATEIIDKAFEEYSYKINEIIDYLEENKNENRY